MLRNRRVILQHEWTPLDVSGLVAWYDFGDMDTLFTDAGVTKVSVDGDAIYQASDKSGNGYHVTQATEAYRPLFKTNIKNGHSVALWDGTDDVLVNTSINVSQPDTYIVAFYHTGAKYIFDGIASRQLFETSSSGVKVHQYAGTSSYVDSAFTSLTYNIVALVFDGANSFVMINNNMTATSPGANGINQLGLGARLGSTNNLDGYYLEFLLYRGALAPTDIYKIHTYLNNKWSIY